MHTRQQLPELQHTLNTPEASREALPQLREWRGLPGEATAPASLGPVVPCSPAAAFWHRPLQGHSHCHTWGPAPAKTSPLPRVTPGPGRSEPRVWVQSVQELQPGLAGSQHPTPQQSGPAARRAYTAHTGDPWDSLGVASSGVLRYQHHHLTTPPT